MPTPTLANRFVALCRLMLSSPFPSDYRKPVDVSIAAASKGAQDGSPGFILPLLLKESQPPKRGILQRPVSNSFRLGSAITASTGKSRARQASTFRELRNVIERAVIISRGGALDFDLPVKDSVPASSRVTPQGVNRPEPEFLTEAEIQRRERENLLSVLQKTNWKIKGADGAAELLGVKPTTLLTRIKKMGLTRPG